MECRKPKAESRKKPEKTEKTERICNRWHDFPAESCVSSGKGTWLETLSLMPLFKPLASMPPDGLAKYHIQCLITEAAPVWYNVLCGKPGEIFFKILQTVGQVYSKLQGRKSLMSIGRCALWEVWFIQCSSGDFSMSDVQPEFLGMSAGSAKRWAQSRLKIRAKYSHSASKELYSSRNGKWSRQITLRRRRGDTRKECDIHTSFRQACEEVQEDIKKIDDQRAIGEKQMCYFLWFHDCAIFPCIAGSHQWVSVSLQ